MTTTPAAFVAAAQKWVGTRENPAGSNKQPFAALAGHANGQPWCASFVVAVARSVGIKLPSESAYTPTMFQGFVQVAQGFRPRKGSLPGSGISPGDVVFFDFPDSVNRIQHVGICVSATSSSVVCIEGNTSAGSTGSQDNGGGVFMRTRPLAHVAGFGRPNFAASAVQPKEPVVPEGPPVYPCKAQVIAFTPLYNQATGQVFGYYMVTADGEVFGFSCPGFNLPMVGRVDTAAIA